MYGRIAQCRLAWNELDFVVEGRGMKEIEVGNDNFLPFSLANLLFVSDS